MNEKTVTGTCLCGHVEYEIKPPYLDFSYCHCERCRKATGSAHTAHIFIPKDNLRWISGEKDVTIFKHSNADDYPRAFCKKCGSSVPRLARDGVRMVVPAGALDQDPGIRPNKSIFWKLRAPWFISPGDLAMFEERPAKK